MNKNLLRRIFAIIALIAAVGSAVTISLYFFNMLGDNAGIFGAIATAFVCVTAVFFILAYILKPREETDLGCPDDVPSDDDADGSVPGSGETQTDESDVKPDHDVIPDGHGDEEGKDEQG